jgi:hypothetical protein
MPMNASTVALKPGAKWGKGPPGLAGLAWPGADEDCLCASCGSPVDRVQEADAGSVVFCPSCQEGSHLGEFSEVYVELGGGG